MASHSNGAIAAENERLSGGGGNRATSHAAQAKYTTIREQIAITTPAP